VHIAPACTGSREGSKLTKSLCKSMLAVVLQISTKKSGKKRSLTRVEALSGALPPCFGGVRVVSIQTASMRWETGTGWRSTGGAAWCDGFYRQPGRKGNMHRLILERN
jgi:hypothetical protein